MNTDLHDLKPGYYWYTMASDPLAVIHIHEDGGATLMGTDYRPVSYTHLTLPTIYSV